MTGVVIDAGRRVASRLHRCVARRLLAACVLVPGTAAALSAQERLVGRQSAGFGMSFESIEFAGSGLVQAGYAGLDSARITSVRQRTLPITTGLAFGTTRFDLTALYSSSTVNYRDATDAGDARSATLEGISDLRVRATSAFVSNRLVLTMGINIPTGLTSLSESEFSVLRIVAAPALGLGSTPVGAGASGTMGVVFARRMGPWSMAMGGSYEYRGSYQPVAALVAGAPSANFQPGSVLRGSVTADRTVGPHRLSLSVSADVFAEDELQSPPTAVGTPPAPASNAVVQLGPVFSTDAQMQFAAPHFRQLFAYAAYRYRSEYSRDAVVVANSNGQYLDSGMRAAIGLGPQRDLILGLDTRLHSGLGVDEGLPTSGVASGSLSVGMEWRRGLTSVQPYVRGQGGVLQQRGVSPAPPSQSFGGFAFGLVAVTRF